MFHLRKRTTAAGIPVLRRIPTQTIANRLANAEFDQKDLMLNQFWPKYTAVHVFVGVMHWGSGFWGIPPHDVSNNILQPQNKPERVQKNVTAQRYRDDILQPLMLNVIDRQRKVFQQDNAWPHTARVAMESYLRTTLRYCHGPQITGFEPHRTSVGWTW